MGLYAAYGSNMDPAQMLRRCPSSPHTGTGWIKGWRLTFGAEEYGWEGALATLVPDDTTPGESLSPGVFVALYDLTEADERAQRLARTLSVEIEHWPTSDPSVVEGSREVRLAAYRALRDELSNRIERRFGAKAAP